MGKGVFADDEEYITWLQTVKTLEGDWYKFLI